MTRRFFLHIVLAAVVQIVLSGCEASQPSRQVADLGSVVYPATAAGQARAVVQSYIWEQTAEGAPFFIGSVPTTLTELRDEVSSRGDRLICTALFSSNEKDYLVEFELEKDLDVFLISRIMLREAGGRAVEESLYDRTELVR